MMAETKTEPRRLIDRPGFQLAHGIVPEREDEAIPEECIVGRCPECGDSLLSNLYWHPEKGYLLRYECVSALLPNGRCHFYCNP